MLLVDNCTAHQMDELDLPDGLSLHFLLTNLTHSTQPSDMGMIVSIKVGYKSIELTYLLGIFNKEGGYKSASCAWAGKKAVCRRIAYGGKPHILDAMEILSGIWNTDGSYDKIYGIKRC